jgi:hypothetical protein
MEIAESGYGSEENYGHTENNAIQVLIKYPGFHARQKKKYKDNAFLPGHLFYSRGKDYFVCPMGKHMEKQYTTATAGESGCQSEITACQAKNCENYPVGCPCFNASGNRKKEISHHLRRLKNKARELLHSEEDIAHRKRRY